MRTWRRNQFEANMDSELRSHIEFYVADLVCSGVNLKEAERRARIEFGSVEARKDECRQAWGFSAWMKFAPTSGSPFGPSGRVLALRRSPFSRWH